MDIYNTLKPFANKICNKPKFVITEKAEFYNHVDYISYDKMDITIAKDDKVFNEHLNFRVPINRIVKELKPDTLEIKGINSAMNTIVLHTKIKFVYS